MLIPVVCLVLSGCAPDSDSPWEQRQAADSDERVRSNMRAVQIAAEHYAARHGGNNYPKTIDREFKTFFPGGVEGKTPSPVGLLNPFSAQNEFPSIGNIQNPAALRQAQQFAMPPGKIQYSVFADGHAYAIIGGAHDGKLMMDKYSPKEVLVFTNVPRADR